MAANIQHSDAYALAEALTKHILGGGSPIHGYTEAARMVGRTGDERHMGQVTSRIDLASFYAGLPMLALHWIRKPDSTVNPASFSGTLWAPLKETMIAAAASHQWTAEELAAVRSRLLELPDDSAELQWNLVETREHERPGYIAYNLHRKLGA